MTERQPTIPDVRPPNPPWLPIENGSSDLATITYYYGDAKSSVVPIRDITHRFDAKHDPNIETLTYGLFSICCKNERKAIVNKGITTQFFCTKRGNGVRVLTGYYHPAWYCRMGPDDYAIAAESIRFVSPGFVLSDLVTFLEGYPIDSFFRTWKYIHGKKVIWRLLLLLNSTPNATEKYVSEIRKFEAYALEQYGRMYFNRLQGFYWEDAAKLFKEWGLI